MHILAKAKATFTCGTRMEKALKLLEDSEMTSKTSDAQKAVDKLDSSVTDTPPATPTTQDKQKASLYKGIPASLLEKVCPLINFSNTFYQEKCNTLFYHRSGKSKQQRNSRQ